MDTAEPGRTIQKQPKLTVALRPNYRERERSYIYYTIVGKVPAHEHTDN